MPLLPNINVGTTANDGTGDDLRTAFTTVNENFQYIEAFFPNTSNIGLTANIDSTGVSTFNNVTISNVTSPVAFTSTSSSSFNNVSIGNITSAVTFTDTITSANITAADISAANISAGNISVSTNISATGNIEGAYILGDGSELTNIVSSLAQYVTQATQSNITSLGTLSSLNLSGNVDTSSNINLSGGNIVFTGSNQSIDGFDNSILLTNVTLRNSSNIAISANATALSLNFAVRTSYAYRHANANIVTTYSNVSAGRQLQIHLKNTEVSTIYVTLPNENNNLASNLVPITSNSVALLNFMCYDNTDANVAVSIIN